MGLGILLVRISTGETRIESFEDFISTLSTSLPGRLSLHMPILAQPCLKEHCNCRVFSHRAHGKHHETKRSEGICGVGLKKARPPISGLHPASN